MSRVKGWKCCVKSCYKPTMFRWFGILVGGLAGLAQAAPSETVDFASLARLVRKERIRSIEALLPRLPASFRARFTLMYASGSNHGATPENPRVLMYGEDARTVIAFNGAPDQAGFLTLEIADYRPDSRRLELRSIQFPKSRRGRVRFSKANPESCQGCHGTPTRWLWNSYNDWPGAYGSDDDDLASEKRNELESYRAFVDKAPKHRRYQYLVYPKPYEGVLYPYYVDGAKRRLPYMGNTQFTKLLFRQQAHRLYGLLRRSPNFARYEGALQYYLAGCYPNFFGEAGPAVAKALGVNASMLQDRTKTILLLLRALGLDPSHDLALQFDPLDEAKALQATDGTREVDPLLTYQVLSPLRSDPKLGRYVRALDWPLKEDPNQTYGQEVLDRVNRAGLASHQATSLIDFVADGVAIQRQALEDALCGHFRATALRQAQAPPGS